MSISRAREGGRESTYLVPDDEEGFSVSLHLADGGEGGREGGHVPGGRQ